MRRRGAKRLGDRALPPELSDRCVVITRFTQDLVAVLADGRRTSGSDFLLTCHKDGTGHRERIVTFEWNKNIVRDELLIGRDILRGGDHIEHNPVRA